MEPCKHPMQAAPKHSFTHSFNEQYCVYYVPGTMLEVQR